MKGIWRKPVKFEPARRQRRTIGSMLRDRQRKVRLAEISCGEAIRKVLRRRSNNGMSKHVDALEARCRAASEIEPRETGCRRRTERRRSYLHIVSLLQRRRLGQHRPRPR